MRSPVKLKSQKFFGLTPELRSKHFFFITLGNIFLIYHLHCLNQKIQKTLCNWSIFKVGAS